MKRVEGECSNRGQQAYILVARRGDGGGQVSEGWGREVGGSQPGWDSLGHVNDFGLYSLGHGKAIGGF